MCQRYGVKPFPALPNMKLGISRTVLRGILPINGLRHPPEGSTTGWYIWAGTELSNDPNFFEPLHVSHLDEWCSEVIPYLALPPGWRFLIAADYEDVWDDPSLLIP
jgi:hypothetical protein